MSLGSLLTVDTTQASVRNKILQILQNQKYHFVGRHSAVKRCRWLHETLINNRVCYKQKFYGIKSHRCLQMSPTVFSCTMRCRFCWRIQSGDLGLKWKEISQAKWDVPNFIMEGCIEEQKRILSGYKGNPETNSKKYQESLTPKHVAISLTGEPTLYPYLDGLIRTFHRKGLTTFLVSNGTLPKALSRLSEEPTQLYVSVSAFDDRTFSKVCCPTIPRAWKNLKDTLSLLPSFKCPTVIRLTLARNLNLGHPKLYAQLLARSNPTYIEPKAYMHVGFSRLRLSFKSMPTHQEIKDFAGLLGNEMGYNTLDEAPESRVVLLSHLKRAIRL